MNTELFNKFQLTNKVAIITGGVGLLGIKHAEAIAEMGGIPILLDIDVEKGKTTAEKLSERYSKKSFFYNIFYNFFFQIFAYFFGWCETTHPTCVWTKVVVKGSFVIKSIS